MVVVGLETCERGIVNDGMLFRDRFLSGFALLIYPAPDLGCRRNAACSAPVIPVRAGRDRINTSRRGVERSLDAPCQMASTLGALSSSLDYHEADSWHTPRATTQSLGLTLR